MFMEKIIYTADAIAIHEETKLFVVVERLGKVKGLALPGGKQDLGELLSTTIKREFFEETNMEFVSHEVLGTYAEANRDPRGDYVSTVFIGIAKGIPKDEAYKTKVLLLTQNELIERQYEFVFDHSKIISDYLALLNQSL